MASSNYLPSFMTVPFAHNYLYNSIRVAVASFFHLAKSGSDYFRCYHIAIIFTFSVKLNPCLKTLHAAS